MTPEYNKVHNKFKLNEKYYNFNELKAFAYSLVKIENPFEQEIGEFLLCWLDGNDAIEVKTSGSTGIPKTITINKQSMVNSAIATGTFFNLKPSSKALLCLPASYIAGKMMLVRAIVLGLELDCIEPKTNLVLNKSKHYHFSAMVPMQLNANIENLKNIDIVIVGGAKVSNNLISKIKGISTSVFETYGMTETVSHIAIKHLNKLPSKLEGNYFKTLPNVSISQDKNECLIINAPLLSKETVMTNDVVKIHSKTTFEWLGRQDNVINSGGIKIFPEQIENQLHDKIAYRFFIASEKDGILGERIILVVEGEKNSLDNSIFKSLNRYSIPKKIYYLPMFIETNSNKINRGETLKLLS
ncbi:AMP-binding protein [uncultured Lacinutrix sp.]|uniref:AMP-binding protein n=1 Tax=uncultured Lacinutrix sp. TaxID=574032 RepID=UPI00261B0766|nr:AMP-binding protein [uncultured Lacinutrix sp.]